MERFIKTKLCRQKYYPWIKDLRLIKSYLRGIRQAQNEKNILLARAREAYKKAIMETSKALRARDPIKKDLAEAKIRLVNTLKHAGYSEGSTEYVEAYRDFHFTEGGDLVIDRLLPASLRETADRIVSPKLKLYDEINLAYFKASTVADAAAAEEAKAYKQIESIEKREDAKIAHLYKILEEAKKGRG